MIVEVSSVFVGSLPDNIKSLKAHVVVIGAI